MDLSNKGFIGKIMEDGFPVIYRIEHLDTPSEIQHQFPSLIVISWTYNGKDNDGMPPPEVSQKMLNLEDAISSINDTEIFTHAHSRTGNNLKEWVYYVQDVQKFMDEFNRTMIEGKYPMYPINIDFFNDKEWLKHQELLDDFAEALKKRSNQND